MTNDYNKFDSICKRELIGSISVDDIINESNFKISLPIDIHEDRQDKFLTINEHLTGLKDKKGLYHLWVENSHCMDRSIYSMICVYVGKGVVLDRVNNYIEKKWLNKEVIYITFYERENRVSKYLEQLFLDSYNYRLNKSVNTGKCTIYARWDDEKYNLGTELQNMADIYAKNNLEV